MDLTGAGIWKFPTSRALGSHAVSSGRGREGLREGERERESERVERECESE